ncbi:phage terminase small subunit [Paenibacillus sp. V4I3]|uniref:terminase n=1 Tax=Paenibacillus sp. V4I3 TaxID=3042305 RepID=UPI0027802F15|nr:terminase [Paenibacillus sp. V4I3]MDQ0876775.1 phage terminase small subunit [Paenibacillus sp. V4I3]
MTRRGQPIDLVVANGRKHLTKTEIQQRKDSEIKLGKKELDKLKPPSFVKNDTVAFSYWKQHMKEYKEAAEQGIELLSSSDIGILGMYCQTYAEYERLLRSYQRIDSMAENCDPLEEYMYDVNVFSKEMMKMIASMVSIDGLLRIESAINKKADMLLKMQDRLFLNPLAKVKNVLKPTKKEEEKQSKFGRFGGGRGG